MHYRNGREAKNGDRVVQLGIGGGASVEKAGVLQNATAGNDYCNGEIVSTTPLTSGACLVDCLHEDDLIALLAEKGLDKRPAGK